MTKEGEEKIAENLHDIAEAIREYAGVIALKTIVEQPELNNEIKEKAMEKLYKWGRGQLPT